MSFLLLVQLLLWTMVSSGLVRYESTFLREKVTQRGTDL